MRAERGKLCFSSRSYGNGTDNPKPEGRRTDGPPPFPPPFPRTCRRADPAETVANHEKSTLALKSAWIINQKSGGRTPSASADTLAGTSETNGRSSTKRKQATSPSSNAEALNSTSKTLPRIKPVSTDSISQNTENVNSESQKGKKFALPDTDSDGGKLNAEQRVFFGKSAIVDADGRLLALYHQTEKRPLCRSRAGADASFNPLPLCPPRAHPRRDRAPLRSPAARAFPLPRAFPRRTLPAARRV